MLVIGVTDAIELNLLGLLTAVLGLTGTMFCEQPTLVYVGGVFTECVILYSPERPRQRIMPPATFPLLGVQRGALWAYG
jgi:hypothetical protein